MISSYTVWINFCVLLTLPKIGVMHILSSLWTLRVENPLLFLPVLVTESVHPVASFCLRDKSTIQANTLGKSFSRNDALLWQAANSRLAV